MYMGAAEPSGHTVAQLVSSTSLTASWGVLRKVMIQMDQHDEAAVQLL